MDYDANSKLILLPLTLIFTSNEITHENTPISPWVLGDDGNNMYPDLEPDDEPQSDDNRSVTKTEGDKISKEEMLHQPIFDSRGRYDINFC